jgi:pyridoxal phosphate enzyme (YggS family)
MEMKTIAQNLQAIQNSLPKQHNIKIVVVTKTRTPKEIEEAIGAGALFIGENRVQEAEKKFSKISNLNLVEKRLIGTLQTNKVNKAIKLFDVIDSVDSLRLAKKISEASLRLNKKQRVLIQINSGGEETKKGFGFKDKKTIIECIKNEGILVEGLMTMGPNTQQTTKIEQAFIKTKNLFDEINKDLEIKMTTLSMGMSGDFRVAVLNGSTAIRIGTAIFGPRH